jgi:hypothetical protein
LSKKESVTNVSGLPLGLPDLTLLFGVTADVDINEQPAKNYVESGALVVNEQPKKGNN